jgi:hypothetical protein
VAVSARAAKRYGDRCRSSAGDSGSKLTGFQTSRC